MTHSSTSLSSSFFAWLAQPEGALPKVPPSSQFWMPDAGSELAESIDGLFYYILWVSSISVLGVLVAAIIMCVRYRASSREANEQALSQADHSTALEIIWSVAPFFFLVSIFVWGFKDYVALRSAPRNALEVYATGQKWQWTFKYPNGHVDSELHVPQGRNVRIVIKSVDVLHSLFIPEYRVKMDAVPGRYTDLWLNAKYPGTFPVFCAEYCGKSHSDMLSQVVVHEGDGYEQWLLEKERELENMPPVQLGEVVFKQFGCGACHSLDGSPNTGPSLKGIWGKTETMTDGRQITVDENYVRRSVLEPMADIVQGYPPQMPSFKGQISDKKLDGLIAYIKSLE